MDQSGTRDSHSHILYMPLPDNILSKRDEDRVETAHACAKTCNFVSTSSSLQQIPKFSNT